MGLLLLTVQILVHLFEYVVNTGEIVQFFISTWAGLLGYVLMLVLFIKSRLGADFILTLIGSLLWGVQFFQVFQSFKAEYLSAFLYCSAGISGVIFILVGLILCTLKSKKENKY